MFRIKQPLVRLIFSLVLAIGLVSSGHEALAQSTGAITNPAQLPNAFNPNTTLNSTSNPNPFQNPFLFVNPAPNLVQPVTPVTPGVNPNAAGITDPLGNPYPFVIPNPISNPNVVTPSLTPNMVPGVTPNSSTLSNMPNTTGLGIVGGVAPSGGAGNPSGAGGREFDQIVE
jgi:hypothetical protein